MRKSINFLGVSLMILSFVTIFFYKEFLDHFSSLIFLFLFITGFLLTMPYHFKKDIRKVNSGEVKAAVYKHHRYTLNDVLLSISGLTMLIYGIYYSIKTNSPDINIYTLFAGFFMFTRVFLNRSSFFVMLDDKNLRIKGTSMEINKISEIRIEQNTITVYKGDNIKDFGIDQLNNQEQKELIDFLLDSELKEKANVYQC